VVASNKPTTTDGFSDVAFGFLAGRTRWKIAEILFWAAALGSLFLLPRYHLLLNEIAILGLFAVSLDLILGYSGIVTLGHAAFFGVGAYAAGLLAKYGWAEPTAGLAVAGLVGGLTGFVASFLIIRGSDLSRLMVTIGVALVFVELANSWSSITGGADGLQGITMQPILGWFSFDLRGTTAFAYSLTVLAVLFYIARRIVNSAFGLSLKAIRDNAVRAEALGVPVTRRMVQVYTLSAVYAGIAGGLLAQTTQFVSLDVLDFARSADLMLILIIGGAGYLYGGLVGAIGFKIAQDWLSGITPQYWQFWIGIFLVVFMLVGRERFTGGGRALLLWITSLFGGKRGSAS
jgi:branched-chain amino acid transport system permease protein